jgi:phosphoglycerate dehydrogenase-like enzyme
LINSAAALIMDGVHPFVKMPNVLCTPLGRAESDNFELYFHECFEQINKFEKGEPPRLGNPTVKPRYAAAKASWCAAENASRGNRR